MLKKFDRIAGFGLHLEQALQPLMGLLLQFGQRGVGAFVKPVRGDAGLGNLVHFGGADLDLDRAAEGTEQGGVQRLVAVGLGNCDVVLELAGNRFVQTVQQAECDVAGHVVVDDDAEAEHVVHLRERQVLFAHLAVYGVQVFLAPLHLRFNALIAQPALDAVEHLADHLAAVAARGTHSFGEHAETVRKQVTERQVFHLLVDAVEAQPVGDGCVDFERFARDALAFFRMHGIQRTHVVQPVGEFDQHHAHVACHRQQHLAEIFRLRFFLGIELDAVEFRNAVDQFGHRPSELFSDFAFGDFGVFDDVVQQCCGQRL